jgi:hypothetical protein
MTLPRSVADVLADHVVFEVECIDRLYCNVYVPQLQHAGGLLGYIQRQLGLPIASTAPPGKITDAFSAAMRRFARDQQVPWVDFVKGQRKDDVMHEHLARFTGTEGVLFIGRAQEKTSLFRTERRRDAPGDSYPWIVRAAGSGGCAGCSTRRPRPARAQPAAHRRPQLQSGPRATQPTGRTRRMNTRT